MNKVYVIRYEELCSGEYTSGTAYVFKTLEEAEKMLKEIKKDEICSYENNGRNIEDLIHDLITENGFIIDFIDDYTKYVIEEYNVE